MVKNDCNGFPCDVGRPPSRVPNFKMSSQVRLTINLISPICPHWDTHKTHSHTRITSPHFYILASTHDMVKKKIAFFLLRSGTSSRVPDYEILDTSRQTQPSEFTHLSSHTYTHTHTHTHTYTY